MELLKRLYGIHSPSGKEDSMVDFICDWLNKNEPYADFEVDKLGNIYIQKGMADNYPCVVAHTDQVQSRHATDFVSLYNPNYDVIFGYSPKMKEQQGLGADDKNGIWVALKALQHASFIKVALFAGEEIGCVGSSDCNMKFFEDCRWVIQADRRGGCDLITSVYNTDLCSKDFLAALQYSRFGYVEEDGMLTDVYQLKENGLKVSCINISCGYYEPHTDHEFTIYRELQNALNLVLFAVDNLIDVYPHEAESTFYGRYYGGYDWYDYNRYSYRTQCRWLVEDEILGMLERNPNIKLKDVCKGLRKLGYTTTTRREIKRIYNELKEDLK